MRIAVACAGLLLAVVAPRSALAQDSSDPQYSVRVTILSSQSARTTLGYVSVLRGYVDGTPAAFKCNECPALPKGGYEGRWDKDRLRIRWTEAFGKHRVHDDKYEVSLQAPKRDTSWSRDLPVSITAYGVSQQDCEEPVRLAVNVITKIPHPADWRIVMACTPGSWEKASLEFHALGGTRTAFTLWDNPIIPASGTVLTVLNSEQFDRCLRPGCYVHTILHELGHFKRVTGDEAVAEAFVAEEEAALYRESPQTDFPTSDVVVKCLSALNAPCPITGAIAELVEAARKTLQLRAAAVAASGTTSVPNVGSRNYPIAISVIDAQWQGTAGRTVIGSGHADLAIASSIVGFDFTGECPDPLKTVPTQPFYQARWEAEPTRLTVLISNQGTPVVCELHGVTHPGQVYVLSNGTTGMVAEEQFKARVAASKAPTATAPPSAAKPQLTNGDVIVMVALKLSTDVILAKIAASDGRFDTSSTALLKLKAANVPEEIVVEMIKRGSR